MIVDDYKHAEPTALLTYNSAVARPTFVPVIGSWVGTADPQPTDPQPQVFLARGYMPLSSKGGTRGLRATGVRNPQRVRKEDARASSITDSGQAIQGRTPPTPRQTEHSQSTVRSRS